jgi:hypothetical protein
VKLAQGFNNGYVMTRLTAAEATNVFFRMVAVERRIGTIREP